MIQLKPFIRSNREVSRLNAALRLYRNLIPEEARNPEEQIIYWIDNSKKHLTDEFRSLSIHSDNELIGYFQYSYFVDEHLFFFEYLCLTNKGRKGLIRSDFLHALEQYFSANYRPGFMIAFEAVRNKIDGVWVPDKKRLNYYEFLGFRKVEFEYRYPVLQSYGDESYPADLMVRLPGESITITASQLRMILRAIYFKHYLRWDKPFLGPEDFCRREMIINDLYAKEIAVISKTDEFKTTGRIRKYSFLEQIKRVPEILPLLKEIFGNHPLLRICAICFLFLLLKTLLKNDWLFVPFVLLVFAAWCLVDEKEASRKLFVTIIKQVNTRLLRQ